MTEFFHSGPPIVTRIMIRRFLTVLLMRKIAGWFFLLLTLTGGVLAGCAARPPVDMRQLSRYEPSTPRITAPPKASKPSPQSPKNLTQETSKAQEDRQKWTMRVITDKEIDKLKEKDPHLTRLVCWEILGRLNNKSALHISNDIKKKKPLKVPVNFAAYKKWTPIPENIAEVRSLPKFILIVKDIPFLGCYENGKIVADTQICIGKENPWTQTGLYSVLEKDKDHVSQSYTNANGDPAAMPLALRIYGHVWIHAGDVSEGYCSHGCINLPWASAEALYSWATVGTPVLVCGSLKNLAPDLKTYAGQLKKGPDKPKKPPPNKI